MRDASPGSGWTVLLLAAVWVAALAGTACQSGSPEALELERQVDYRIEPAGTEQTLRSELLEDVRDADTRIWAALAADTLDAKLADALVQAADDGLDVQVVGDADARNSGPFETLRNSKVETTFGDGALSYLPDPNLSQVLARCRLNKKKRVTTCSSANTSSSPCGDTTVRDGQGAMCRPGSFNQMSHRFVLIDRRTVWNFAGGFEALGAGNLGWRAESELIHEDFAREFRQMSGGVFSTTLDVYNGPVKSGTDSNVDYTTNHGMLQIRFNPQERLMKHVIDEVYRARSSIQITASAIRNPFLLDALQYKKNHGFEVQIVVGEDGDNGGQPPGNAKQRLRKLGARAHPAGGGVPSAVVIDALPKSEGGRQWPRTAIGLSHPLWHAQPYSIIPPGNNGTDDRVRIYPSDHFVDGNLWKLYEYSSNVRGAPQIDRMQDFVESAWNQASSL